MIERPSAKIGENFTIDIFSKNIKKTSTQKLAMKKNPQIYSRRVL